MERAVKRRGLSLTETILSLFLMGMLAVLLANLFPSSVAAARQDEDRLQAELLAESLLAERAALDFEDLALGPPTTLAAVRSASGLEYRPTVEVFQVGSRNTDYLRGLRITVEWKYREIDRKVVRELWVPNLRR